jgi:hypothetical protein
MLQIPCFMLQSNQLKAYPIVLGFHHFFNCGHNFIWKFILTSYNLAVLVFK